MNITETIADRFTDVPRARALAAHLRVHWTQIDECSYNDTEFVTTEGDYQVLTDWEADEQWELSLESYLDDCIYPELPAAMRHYFDDERWKRDARTDGRAHCISHYDGEEHEASDPVTNKDFIIIRTN